MDADCVEVVEIEKNFKSLIAARDIQKATFLGDYRGKVTKQRGRHTVQIEEDLHIASVGNVIYSNHSWSPNAHFIYHPREDSKDKLSEGQVLSWHLQSSRDIKKGEQVTNDYTLTEYSMFEPFDCVCKSSNCLKKVQGFQFLSQEEKKRRLPLASPVVQKLHEEAN